MHDRLKMEGLGEKIDHVQMFDAISGSDQDDEIAGQRGRIARHINNAWRAQGRQHPRHAFSQAISGRIHHRQVGLVSTLGEDCTQLDSPRIFQTGQVLLRRGPDCFSIRGQIVSKIA